MNTIVLFDACPIAHAGFRQILERAAHQINAQAVSSFEELADLAAQVSLDILVVSINTPQEIAPLQLLQECMEILPYSRVILYDEEHSAVYSNQWLQAPGVYGYVLKREPAPVFLRCIDNVLKDGKFLSPAGWEKYIISEKQNQSFGKKPLTRYEFEIAQYLADGYSNTWIANKLGKAGPTISIIKRRIFAKLRIQNLV